MRQTIFKGCHYSTFIPWFKRTSSYFYMERTIAFDESCKYSIDEPSCVNKLFGFCFGFGVHKNSIRFGWTYNEYVNSIYIWSYIYKNGVLTKNKIASLNVGEQHTYRIEVNRISEVLGDYTFRFLIDGNEVSLFSDMRSSACFLTTLGFYFGGKSRAPHKMFINVN